MTVTVPEKNGSLKCAPKKNTRGKSAFSPYATVTMTKKKMCPGNVPQGEYNRGEYLPSVTHSVHYDCRGSQSPRDLFGPKGLRTNRLVVSQSQSTSKTNDESVYIFQCFSQWIDCLS